MILTFYSNFLISVTDISVTGMHLATTTFIECNSNSIWLTFCFNKDATSIGTTVEYRHDNIIIDTNPSPSETILFWSWTNNVNMVSWTVAVCEKMESVQYLSLEGNKTKVNVNNILTNHCFVQLVFENGETIVQRVVLQNWRKRNTKRKSSNF